jgi:hypothetical protein
VAYDKICVSGRTDEDSSLKKDEEEMKRRREGCGGGGSPESWKKSRNLQRLHRRKLTNDFGERKLGQIVQKKQKLHILEFLIS